MQVSQFSRPLRAFYSSRRLWLVLLLLAAWGLRLAHLDTMSIWWDESLSWDRAMGDLPAILANLINIQTVATHDLHPPLYFLLLHFVVLAAGTTEFALRFLSAFANLLTLAMLYPLSQALLGTRGRNIGLLTVLLATFSPLYIWYSQEARPYGLVLFWSVAALYALLRWLKTKPTTWRALLNRWSLVFWLMLGASLTTLYLAFVLLPFYAVALWLWDETAPDARTRLRTLPTLVGILLVIAFGAILVLLPRGDALASWDQAGPSFVPLFTMMRDVWNSYVVGVTANLDQAAWLDLFLLALWLVGVFSTIRAKSRDARLALFLLGYILVPTLAMQFGSYLRPLYLNSRHLITTSPAFYLGIALGMTAIAGRLASRVKPGTWRAGALSPSSLVFAFGVLVLALPYLGGALFSLDNLYRADPAFAKDNHKAWSEFLRERLRPDDYLLLVAPQAEKIVKYYAPPGLQWESLPHLGQTQDWQEFLDRESVLNAYRNHPRVWFLEIHQPVGDPKFAINNLMHKYGESVDIVYFPAISSRIILQQFVYKGVEQKRSVKIPNPLHITYDDNLHLIGYAAPAQIEPGKRDAVTLYWRLDQKTPDDVSVSLRVLDAAGKSWGQWDAQPIGNLYPVSSWHKNTIYVDMQDFVVDAGAPPGDYTIELSVYRTAGHEPLRASLSAQAEPLDSVPLAHIQVTRPNPPRDPQTLIIDQHFNQPVGDAVRFVGYDIENRNPSPGGDVPLTLYFQVMQAQTGVQAGSIELHAPWWQFWNRVQSLTPFALDLTDRLPGDIVQARVNARVPGDAGAGGYTLQIVPEGSSPFAFADVTVGTLARSTELPSIATPMHARLGDSVEFLGYEIDAAAPLHPNDPVKLKLYWRALKTIDTSYKVFTHLLGTDNQVRGQQDKLPLDGARPTTSWAPGEIFTDTYQFNVSPDAPGGRYQIEIGMYDPDNSTRLASFDANGSPTGDRILFGDLSVQ